RQVRPETFTMAAFLGAACLLSLRSERRKVGTFAAAGALSGIGLTGHPVGAVTAPIVALFLAAAVRRTTWRTAFAFAVPAVLVTGSYLTFLLLHREGVVTALALHATQRSLGPSTVEDVLAREALRYTEGYLSGYAQRLGSVVHRAAWIGWGLLAVAAAIRYRRERAPPVGRLRAP